MKKEKKQEKNLMDNFGDKKSFMSTEQVFKNILTSKISSKVGRRMIDCSEDIILVADETLENKKVAWVNSCGNRFCAICSWRKARKEAVIISVAMSYIRQKSNKSFIFLSLTAPNVSGEDLPATIDKFNLAFKKLIKRKEVAAINKGYVRKLEVTYRGDEKITKEYYKEAKGYCDRRGLAVGDDNPNYNTYHPHFHVIMAVDKSYSTNTRKRLKTSEWLELWRSCMQDNRITQVHYRTVTDDDNDETEVVADDGTGVTKVPKSKKAVFEVAKYSAKDTDLHKNEESFKVFYNSLKGRQLLTYNGLFKDAIKLYKEYIKIKDENKRKAHELHEYLPLDPYTYVYRLLYAWGRGEYVEKEQRALTTEERKAFNQMIQEESADNLHELE